MTSKSFFQNLIQLKKTSDEPLTYESISNPVRIGQAAMIAFGGFNQALAVQSAFQSLPSEEWDNWSLYSMNGLFLGPTALDRPVSFTVTKLRDTKSFITRQVLASQLLDNGNTRKCHNTTIDFTIKKSPLEHFHSSNHLPLSYSISPPSLPPFETLSELQDMIKDRVDKGELQAKFSKAFHGIFSTINEVNKVYLVPGSLMYDTIFGVKAKKIEELQKRGSIEDRYEAFYFQSKDTLAATDSSNTNKEVLAATAISFQAAFAAFVLDGALAFYPLIEHGLFLQDAGACSTLDSALRFHTDDYDFNEPHIRKIRTYSADCERTFSESLVWDLKGKLVASCTQQCILRPKTKSTTKESKM